MVKAIVQARKGILLFMVLGMILIITILATVILNIISIQSRITHHQVSRIQAYYAAQAGMNYALEMLRTGEWDNNFCPPAFPCTVPFSPGDFYPPSVISISVIIKPIGFDPTPGVGPTIPNSAPVIITVDYTPPPP